MQEQIAPRRGGAAFIWKWGAIAGVALGVLQILISLLSLGQFGTLLNLLVWLIGFFLIGMFAARITGKVGTASLTGLVMGMIGGLISVLFVVIEIAANGSVITQALNQATQSAQQQGQSLSSSDLHTVVIIGIVIGLIVTVAFELGLGAGIGALGGLVGRRQAPVAPIPYVENLWTPQSSAPPYPPMPPGPSAPQE